MITGRQPFRFPRFSRRSRPPRKRFGPSRFPWTYRCLHVNNDTPGTDDGNGGLEHAYAPDILSAYQSLLAASLVTSFSPGAAEAAAVSINVDRGLAVNPNPGTLIFPE